jgi:hypothetical protein
LEALVWVGILIGVVGFHVIHKVVQPVEEVQGTILEMAGVFLHVLFQEVLVLVHVLVQYHVLQAVTVLQV